MFVSHVVACGFLVALLALEAKSAPRPRHKVPVWQDPSRDTAALGRELAELLAEAFSGPVSRGGGGGGGGKPDSGRQRQQQQHRSKGASSSSSTSRAMWDLRTDAKQARPGWGRLGHSEHPQGGGGGGGGGGGSRRSRGSKKGLTKGCFGLKLDRIGTMSGLGC